MIYDDITYHIRSDNDDGNDHNDDSVHPFRISKPRRKWRNSLGSYDTLEMMIT